MKGRGFRPPKIDEFGLEQNATMTSITDQQEIISRLNSWLNASDAELRLRLGELTAQEIRTLRAVLKAIAGLPLT